MFELIGLFFDIAFLFVLASVLSVFLAGITWLCLRNRRRRLRLTVAAALIPLASASYLLLCFALLPGESLFGDINEPLPNGYRLEALGKMPDFANISNPAKPFATTGLSQCIDKLALDGQLVVGQYSHPFSEFTPQSSEAFFIFDTRQGHTTEFPTQSALETELGHPVTLTPAQFFLSPLAVTQRRLEHTIELGPPLVTLLLLIVSVWRNRRRGTSSV